MREKFDDEYSFNKWTIDDFIKAQECMTKLIEIFNNDKKITDIKFFETAKDFKYSFESIFEDFDLLLSEVYPETDDDDEN